MSMKLLHFKCKDQFSDDRVLEKFTMKKKFLSQILFMLI